ncbi:YhjD/YihY/BrkB family envelope integrity protein [Nocardia sp. NPDC057668]|uniref:YihY/virulence factor BrkB family protein n=1 Tax=Nocardia sp. NPDC057668 TaxID=3346202 RepID=UPI00366C30E5
MSESVVVAEDHPATPADMRRESWLWVLRRTAGQLLKDKLTDWAATLTYYSVLSIFPGILVLSAMLSMLGPNATGSLIDTVREIGPGSGTALLVDALRELDGSSALAGPLAIAGLVTAMWTASGYIGAFIRAVNSIYGTEEGRPIWKTVPLQLGLTAIMMVLVALCGLGVVASGTIADKLGHWLGMGSAGITIWNIAKWPVLALLVSLALATLYWIAPNARQLGFRWLTPGSVLAVFLWIVASAGFAFYAANFGTYNKVYGSLAGAVVFLIWLWLTNLAVLLGAQFDADLARGRRLEQGGSPEDDPVLPPRDAPPPAEDEAAGPDEGKVEPGAATADTSRPKAEPSTPETDPSTPKIEPSAAERVPEPRLLEHGAEPDAPARDKDSHLSSAG